MVRASRVLVGAFAAVGMAALAAGCSGPSKRFIEVRLDDDAKAQRYQAEIVATGLDEQNVDRFFDTRQPPARDRVGVVNAQQNMIISPDDSIWKNRWAGATSVGLTTNQTATDGEIVRRLEIRLKDPQWKNLGKNPITVWVTPRGLEFQGSSTSGQ